MSTTTFVASGGALDDWLADRRSRGLDGRDEVWDGVYHVVPHAHASHGALAALLQHRLMDRADAAGLTTLGEFNLGTSEKDYRVPDLGWTSLALEDLTTYLPSVDVVVEFESPGDETWSKLPFYFERGVREVWVVSPHSRGVRVLTAPGRDAAASGVLDVSVGEIVSILRWG